MPQALIEFRQITKRFAAVHALTDVSFEVASGSFHAVCGENGAGKSTLMKILSGVITDYDGQLVIDGQPVRFHDTRDAEAHGVSIIHQELNLVGQLSATANLFLGREPRRGGIWLDEAAMQSQAALLLGQLECQVPPHRLVQSLRIGDQQLVEIAKALAQQARLLIMDEPTSALTESEVERLFRVIARLRAQGVTIIYISHKMDEVFRHADRITVLRDGAVVQTLDRSNTSPAEVTRLMVGRELAARPVSAGRQPGDLVLEVRHLSLPWPGHVRNWRLQNLQFDVRRGEVLGIAGLMGAGRTELLECLFGSSAESPQGELRLHGKPVRFAHPSEALQAGVAMVTEDRKRDGVIAPLNVREHITLSSLWSLSSVGVVSARREQAAAVQMIDRLRVRTAGSEARLTSLSGGNQQKCLIARALLTQPSLLLLDDPTRGIDVGAKAEIYQLIDELCAQGLAIILTSSELPELLTVCDRILVLCEGRQTGLFSRDEFDETRLMAAATGTDTAA